MKDDVVSFTNSKGIIYLTVYYDTDLKATVDEWVGEFESKENFILGLNSVLDNIKKHQSRNWLADLSKIEGDFSFMKDYILKFIIPEAKEAGLFYEAIVLPYNIFAILAVQTAMEEYEGIEIHLFSSVGEASEWLKSKK